MLMLFDAFDVEMAEARPSPLLLRASLSLLPCLIPRHSLSSPVLLLYVFSFLLLFLSYSLFDSCDSIVFHRFTH